MSSGSSGSSGKGGSQGYSGPTQSQGSNWDAMMQNLAGLDAPPASAQTENVGNNNTPSDTSGPVTSKADMAVAQNMGKMAGQTGVLSPALSLVGALAGYFDETSRQAAEQKSPEGTPSISRDSARTARKGLDDDDEGLGGAGAAGSSGLSGSMDAGYW